LQYDQQVCAEEELTKKLVFAFSDGDCNMICDQEVYVKGRVVKEELSSPSLITMNIFGFYLVVLEEVNKLSKVLLTEVRHM
jgi:hypothetical protein